MATTEALDALYVSDDSMVFKNMQDSDGDPDSSFVTASSEDTYTSYELKSPYITPSSGMMIFSEASSTSKKISNTESISKGLDFEAFAGQTPTLSAKQVVSVDLETEAAIALVTLPGSCKHPGIIGVPELKIDLKAQESSDAVFDHSVGELFAPLNSDTLKAQLSKRPKNFHAITVFQESVLYSEYEPFHHKEGHAVDYSILVDDFKRWKVYTNILVKRFITIILRHVFFISS